MISLNDGWWNMPLLYHLAIRYGELDSIYFYPQYEWDIHYAACWLYGHYPKAKKLYNTRNTTVLDSEVF